jgi:hypothetical protein
MPRLRPAGWLGRSATAAWQEACSWCSPRLRAEAPRLRRATEYREHPRSDCARRHTAVRSRASGRSVDGPRYRHFARSALWSVRAGVRGGRSRASSPSAPASGKDRRPGLSMRLRGLEPPLPLSRGDPKQRHPAAVPALRCAESPRGGSGVIRGTADRYRPSASCAHAGASRSSERCAPM